MAYSITRETPMKGLSFVYITDPKYRVDSVVVRLVLPVEERSPQIYRMLGMMMEDSTARFPQRSLMSEKLKSLYGASQYHSLAMLGDNSLITFKVCCIGDRFTIDGENITTEAAQLMLDMIFSPNVSEGAFNEKYFEMVRREIIEAIKSLPNNRHNHALRRARENAFAGEPTAYPSYGTIEWAQELTPAKLYEEYKRMLSVAGIYVFFCGSGNNTEAQQLVKQRFTEFAARRLEEAPDIIVDKESLIAPSPVKEQTLEVREKIEQEQMKLVMIFKSEGKDMYAERVFCSLYGGSPISKLFTNVREKLSLCYYCQSYMMEFKSAMVVDSGIDTVNEDLARKEILHQLELIKKGDFSDEVLENIKKSLCGALRTAPDSPDDLNSIYFLRLAKGVDITPDKEIELYKEVTRERVIAAAKGMRLDTVYVLEPEAEKEGEQ